MRPDANPAGTNSLSADPAVSVTADGYSRIRRARIIEGVERRGVLQRYALCGYGDPRQISTDRPETQA
ncbi:hypothetical protein GCM10027167_76740 [Nocardia heshunensis]